VQFAYYRRLTARQKRIYDRSDAIPIVRVPGATGLSPQVAALARGLERDDREATELAARRLTDDLLGKLALPPVRLRVLAVRPTENWGELHGLYEFGGKRQRPVISVWMRTAQRRNVVAFRTFLRTLLHEIGHHLDYEMLGLEDSYHTQGFYKREASLFHQLVPDAAVREAKPASAARRAPRQAARASAKPKQRAGAVQARLPFEE